MERQVLHVVLLYTLKEIVSAEKEGEIFDSSMTVFQGNSFCLTNLFPFYSNYQYLTQHHLWYTLG